MSEALLGRWVRTARAAVRPVGSEALEQENKHLWVHLARTEMEREVYKKRRLSFRSLLAD